MKPLRLKVIQAAWSVSPPPLWNALTAWRGHPKKLMPSQFGEMLTTADPSPLVSGKFAELFEQYRSLDPFVTDDVTRYRIYNICHLAQMCSIIPGDLVFAGVSFGVAPRIVFDFVDVPSSEKMLRLIDPFDGSGRPFAYNTDDEFVRSQYPTNSHVKIHRSRIPDALPLGEKISFVACNTGMPDAEARSIPLFYEELSPGGAIVVDSYSRDSRRYDSAFQKVGATPIWFPSGQAAIIKT